MKPIYFDILSCIFQGDSGGPLTITSNATTVQLGKSFIIKKNTDFARLSYVINSFVEIFKI